MAPTNEVEDITQRIRLRRGKKLEMNKFTVTSRETSGWRVDLGGDAETPRLATRPLQLAVRRRLGCYCKLRVVTVTVDATRMQHYSLPLGGAATVRNIPLVSRTSSIPLGTF